MLNCICKISSSILSHMVIEILRASAWGISRPVLQIWKHQAQSRTHWFNQHFHIFTSWMNNVHPINRNYERPRNFSMKMSTRRSISWPSKSQTQHPSPGGFLSLIELDDGKIYRKALYLMVKTMVSCRFSLKPIQWKSRGLPGSPNHPAGGIPSSRAPCSPPCAIGRHRGGPGPALKDQGCETKLRHPGVSPGGSMDWMDPWMVRGCHQDATWIFC